MPESLACHCFTGAPQPMRTLYREGRVIEGASLLRPARGSIVGMSPMSHVE
jgi:hypothetical protein